MTQSRNLLTRTSALVAASALAVASVVPALLLGHASAAQVTSRSIKMSNSAISATDVTYATTFTAPTAGNVGGVVVDFCANSPLIGVSCTAPTGFDINEAGLAVANLTGLTGFTKDAASDTNTVILTNGTPQSISANTTISFDLGSSGGSDGITNTSTLGTFYARIVTFSTDAGAQGYTPTATTGFVDQGGVALSTANTLQVTARVQESLRFCIYTTGSDCSGGTGNAIDIPDATTPLSTGAVQTANAFFGLASNALNGVTVRMRGFDPATPTNSRATLTSGSFSITATGAGAGTCTADSTTSTVEQFGMRIEESTSVTPATPYNCAATNHGWDSTGNVDTDNVTSTYGDTIATTTGPHDEEQNTLEFGAKSALTSEAGIYTIGLNFIATGVY